MRAIYFLLALVVATVLFFYFAGNFADLIKHSGSNGTSDVSGNNRPATKAVGNNSAPDGFQGPSGQPHVVGPKTPPPSY